MHLKEILIVINDIQTFLSTESSAGRILVIVIIAVGSHIAVIFIRRFNNKLMSGWLSPSLAKIRTILTLGTSIIVFSLYFGAIGFIVREFGLSLKTYLASASILGLAIGFGSQGLVQDVVTGLTLVFSSLINVGDMAEIGGQVGIVQRIGMRFTVLENSFGAEVHVPNRTITNVINYPRGYIRCLVDITLPTGQEVWETVEKKVESVVTSLSEQFPGILLTPPSIEGRVRTGSGKTFLRIKFRIWPGRGITIETTFKQEIVQAIKDFEPAYADWMVAVNYEVEKHPVPISYKVFRRPKEK